MTAVFPQKGLVHQSQQGKQPCHQRQFECQSHAKHQHHEIVDVRVQGNLILDGCAQLISGKETQCQRIDHKIPQQHTDEEHHRTYTQRFPHPFTLVWIECRAYKAPDFIEKIRSSRYHRHPESSRHVDKERCGKIDIDELHMKLLGKEFILQIQSLPYPAQQVIENEVVMARSQYHIVKHDIRLELQDRWRDIDAETIIADISNATRMEDIFREFKPQYIFHAAAYKHVPMMEDNVSESIQVNVFGTRTVADLAVKYGAEKFVMISTDKAVNPTNVMGCSKRICEIYVQSLAKKLQKEGGHATQFITTRFGNVLGSNGSVIPRFRDQIQRGGPVTVTHPEIIRYFMTIPEACRLVLEAGSMGNGGEIYIFDMGKPVKIVDLAKRMISLSGRTDVKIEFTGLRHGEKLYEELLNVKELTKPTYHEKIMIATVREYDYDEVKERIQKLIDVSYTYDQMKIVAAMKDIVPEFVSKNSCFEALDKKK